MLDVELETEAALLPIELAAWMYFDLRVGMAIAGEAVGRVEDELEEAIVVLCEDWYVRCEWRVGEVSM